MHVVLIANKSFIILQPASNRVNDIQTNNYGNLLACCCNNGDVYAIELVDSVAGICRDIKIEELDVGYNVGE